MKRSKEYHDRIRKLFPVAKIEDYAHIVWPEHISSILNELDETYAKPHGLKLPAYVYKVCNDNISLEPYDFIDKCLPEIKASAHLNMLSNISYAKEPMSEEVKAHLRELNESKRKRKEEALELSDSEERTDTWKSEKTEAEDETVSGPEGVRVGLEVSSHEQRDGKPDTNRRSQVPNRSTSAGSAKESKVSAKNPSRIPIYEDKVRQEEMIKKYPWAIAGSFVQDPEKPGSTLIDILCTKCKVNRRTIHAPDLFQVKMCKPCKSK